MDREEMSAGPDLRCYYHPDREATSQCDRCGDYLCGECVKQFQDQYLCDRCWQEERGPDEAKAKRWLQIACLSCAGGLALYLVDVGWYCLQRSSEGFPWARIVVSRSIDFAHLLAALLCLRCLISGPYARWLFGSIALISVANLYHFIGFPFFLWSVFDIARPWVVLQLPYAAVGAGVIALAMSWRRKALKTYDGPARVPRWLFIILVSWALVAGVIIIGDAIVIFFQIL